MFARGSLPWISSFLIAGFILLFLEFIYVGFMILILSLLFMIFFRDPSLSIGEGIISPADGKVSQIIHEENGIRISILMGLRNIHVNRSPLNGKVLKIQHHVGKHIPVFKKDSDLNEHMTIELDTKIGKVRIVQIAGAFARRIVCYINEGEELSKGQRIGMIRFGSRVDLILPRNKVKLEVEVDSKAKVGTTTLAREENNVD